MPPNSVKVDRSTKWGNPFVPGQPAPVGAGKGRMVLDSHDALALYRSLVASNVELTRAAKNELHGKNLACWCKADAPCHADILLAVANQP